MILLPTQDSCLWSRYPTTPYGADPSIRAAWFDSKVPYKNRALLAYDLSSTGITVVETAFMRLRVTESTSDILQYLVCRMLAIWSEAYACWNLRDAGIPWGTPGGDFTSVGAVTFSVIGNGTLQVAIPSLAQYAIDFAEGLLNLIILRASEGVPDGGFVFESRESAHPPELEITGYGASHRIINGSVVRGRPAMRGRLIT